MLAAGIGLREFVPSKCPPPAKSTREGWGNPHRYFTIEIRGFVFSANFAYLGGGNGGGLQLAYRLFAICVRRSRGLRRFGDRRGLFGGLRGLLVVFDWHSAKSRLLFRPPGMWPALDAFESAFEEGDLAGLRFVIETSRLTAFREVADQAEAGDVGHGVDGVGVMGVRRRASLDWADQWVRPYVGRGDLGGGDYFGSFFI